MALHVNAAQPSAHATSARVAPDDAPIEEQARPPMSTGEKIFAGVGGAIVGAFVGALSLMIPGVSPKVGFSLVALGAVAGAPTAIGLGNIRMTTEWNAAEHERTTGESISQNSRWLIDEFDHNGNGVIDLKNPSHIPAMDEFVSTNMVDGRPRSISATELWRHANANGDDIVDETELGNAQQRESKIGPGHINERDFTRMLQTYESTGQLAAGYGVRHSSSPWDSYADQ